MHGMAGCVKGAKPTFSDLLLEVEQTPVSDFLEYDFAGNEALFGRLLGGGPAGIGVAQVLEGIADTVVVDSGFCASFINVELAGGPG